jgi:hypothetical protein
VLTIASYKITEILSKEVGKEEEEVSEDSHVIK